MLLPRRSFLQGAALASLTASRAAYADTIKPVISVNVEARDLAGKLPHIWEECVGSDRAAITLRESWRHDIDRGRAEAGFKRVRFHGIFNDELGVFATTLMSRNSQEPNFQDVDQVYDGLLAHGVSPFVELSFMPQRLASAKREFGFYRGNTSIPTSNEAWADFIRKFVEHLVDRYGIGTIKTWFFEVWNEPNLPFFWSGTKQQYFEFYRATVVAIKSVDPALQVGGPSTALAGWIPDFAGYCAESNTPVDFFTTHIYAGDTQALVFGPGTHMPRPDVVTAAVSRVRQQIDASRFAGRPLWLSEWSSDSPAMIAYVIAGCLPLCHGMSQWVLSGTYEELGVAEHILDEGIGSWSMLADGIPKPSYNTYRLLHALGTERLTTQGPAIGSRKRDGSLAILVWNLADVTQPSGLPDARVPRVVTGETKRMEVTFAGAKAGRTARVRFVDQTRGSAMPAWRDMGSPQYIKPDQVMLLRKSAELAPPVIMVTDESGRLAFDLPPEGVALIELA